MELIGNTSKLLRLLWLTIKANQQPETFQDPNIWQTAKRPHPSANGEIFRR